MVKYKKIKQKNIKIIVDNKVFSSEIIKYTAYRYTDKWWVFIKKEKQNKIVIFFTPKSNLDLNDLSTSKLRKTFLKNLWEEKIRQKIYQNTINLHIWMLKNAINYNEKQINERNDDFVLTPEEEEEINNLIKEVEEELKNKGLSK